MGKFFSIPEKDTARWLVNYNGVFMAIIKYVSYIYDKNFVYDAKLDYLNYLDICIIDGDSEKVLFKKKKYLTAKEIGYFYRRGIVWVKFSDFIDEFSQFFINIDGVNDFLEKLYVSHNDTDASIEESIDLCLNPSALKFDDMMLIDKSNESVLVDKEKLFNFIATLLNETRKDIFSVDSKFDFLPSRVAERYGDVCKRERTFYLLKNDDVIFSSSALTSYNVIEDGRVVGCFENLDKYISKEDALSIVFALRNLSSSLSYLHGWIMTYKKANFHTVDSFINVLKMQDKRVVHGDNN